jgi:hypothetical protein
MSPRKSFIITALYLLFISSTCNAVMCARLKSISAGEVHTLALMDNNTLWACGHNGFWQVGLGGSPVGLALDPASGIAFITYENRNVIELLNAKTMVPTGVDEAIEIEPLTVEEMVDWLDDIWQTGELTMNEQEYL